MLTFVILPNHLAAHFKRDAVELKKKPSKDTGMTTKGHEAFGSVQLKWGKRCRRGDLTRGI